MTLVVRRIAVCLVLAVTGLGVSPVTALGEESPFGGGQTGGPGASALLSGSLVTPGSPFETEQVQAQEEATQSSPEAIATREASRTKFEGLDTEQATKVASEAFPSLIEERAGGPPTLPAGQTITGYLSDNAASIDLGGGKQALVESLVPMAVEGSSGQRTAIDLSLTNQGSSYQPATPAVGVLIPKRLSTGVQLTHAGLTVTPVDGSGTPLAGSEGTVAGATVLYANTLTDTDSVIKPTTGGFEADTILRSAESPQQMSFRIGLPTGASLTPAKNGSGLVRVVHEGVAVAAILPPGAQDATGRSVPVSMSLSGDTLVLSVADHSAEYQYPIDVDPTFIEEKYTESGRRRSNWQWETSKTTRFASKPTDNKETKELGEPGPEYLESYGTAAYSESEKAYWAYQTQGDSKIYEVKAEAEGKNKEDHIESFLELEAHGTGAEESKRLLSTESLGSGEETREHVTLCPNNSKKEQECVSTAGGAGNAVRFQQSVVNKPTSKYSFSDFLYKGEVFLSEPSGTHSTTNYNTSSPKLTVEVENEKKEKVKQERANALYSTAPSWLSEYDGALELLAEDPGIGVSATRLEYETTPGKWEQLAEHNYYAEGDCTGVQCYPKHPELWTLNKRLPNGEDKIRYRAEDAMGAAKHETESLESEGVATVKVDYSKPYDIFISGLPYGNELSERKYELTVYVTDGEGSTVPSSGVKSLEMYVDGKSIEDNEVKSKETREAGKKEGECKVPKGECHASAKFSIEGAELGAGHHSIQIAALDNAGNEGRLPGGGTEVSIRHSTPVAVGPGSVDLESGDFSLGTTDVSMGSGLTLSRNYSSRDTTQGDEGPFGPEWNVSMSSTESLVELVDGSVLMTSANGTQAIFAEPLAGVKCEPGAPFEAPPGDSNLKLWCEENKTSKAREAYYLENAADHTKVKFTLPQGGTKEWVPTVQAGAVATDTVTYEYDTVEGQTEYTLGTANSGPEGITEGPEGDLWYTEAFASKVGKITPTGSTTEYELPKNSWPRRITSGSEGNLWFTEEQAGKVGRITPSGSITQYELPEGCKEPLAITEGSEGDIWYTSGQRGSITAIGRITPSGKTTAYPLPEGSETNGIVQGPEGYIWFTRAYNNPGGIGKLNPATGAVTEYQVHGGGNPKGITVGPEGDLWYANGGPAAPPDSNIGKITPSGEETEYVLPKGDYVQGIARGPEGDLWYTAGDEENQRGEVGKVTPSGTITQYELPEANTAREITAGPEGNMWYADDENKIGEIPTSGTLTQIKQSLAPVPVGVSCTWKAKPSEMGRGCRALEFKYAVKTKSEIGEGPSEWGEYAHRLVAVSIAAYNPANGHEKMEETPVAEYSYDKLGRLRDEIDPRTGLKTTYGYDEYGHITALNPPGEEPWSLTYGTSAGDAGDGRLLKVARAPASDGLWGGELLKNSEVPKVTGTASVGVRLAVSTGKWAGSALTYGYQWEECTTYEVCTPILGADNANYTPVSANAGHELRVLVTATNGGGSDVEASATTAAVAGTNLTQSVDGGTSINAVSCIPGTTDCVVSDSKGNAFYGTNVSTTVGATWSAWAGPTGESPSPAVDCPTSAVCLLADGGNANLFYATSLGAAWTKAFEPAYGVDSISCASSSFCIDGQDGGGYIRYSTNPGSTSWTSEDIAGSNGLPGVSCLSASFCVAVDNLGNIHVATSTSQIESATWTNTDIDGTTALDSIACTSTTSCVAVDHTGNVLNLTIETSGKASVAKDDIDGTNSLTAITCTGGTTCTAVDNEGNIFVSKNGGGTWTNVYALGDDLTSVSCASSTLCATADTEGNVTAFTPAGVTGTSGELHSPGSGTTIDYAVPVHGSGAPYNMSEGEIAKWGQKAEETPVEATAIFPPDSPQGWPASSYTRATIDYLDENGRLVNTASPSTGKYGSVSTTEYNEANDIVRTLTPDNRATALEAGTKSEEVASLLSTFSTFNSKCSKESEFNEERESSEFGTRLCETEGPAHAVKYMVGKEQKEAPYAREHVRYFYDEKVPSEGPENESFAKETFNLLTEARSLTEIVNAKGGVEEEIEPRTTITSYSGQNNLGWKLRTPTSVTVAAESEGAKLTSTSLYYEKGSEATGQLMETRAPEGAAGESAHDKRFIYYTAEANEKYTGCGKHPEWAGLVCESLPAKQAPETTGIPKLPETTFTYNMWDEPEAVEERFPKTATVAEEKRTTKETYDAAGRMTSSEKTSTASTDKTDRALPKVTDVYNKSTGILETQSTTVGEKTRTITSTYNTLGQLETYVDADGNVAKFKYGTPEADGLLEEMSDSSDGGGSSQKYSYSETTMQLTKLVDSAAGTFTASYDTEGSLASEVYPNGMCANYTRNSVGEATHVEYTKTAGCSEKEGVWYSETRNPSARGETMSRTSTLANEEYTYDTVGRLTGVHETPAGEYCKTRIYAYDEESNRTKVIAREPNSKKECASEGGTEEKHTYDEGNRLIDGGIVYDPLGNVTKLPAGDAEGHALESTFYVDNAVATQTQNGVTNDYYLDPEGRTRETITGTRKVITHYDSAGEGAAWTCEGGEKAEQCESGAKWTRNIAGIDGTLTAIQNGTGTTGETPTLQLHDLQGDTVATIKDKASETKLESTYNSTEFGVPNGGKEPPKYAWLGAGGVEKALASGVITEGATSYVPQTGRALQSEGVAPPGLPDGSGAGSPYIFEEEPWVLQGATREADEAPGLEAGREKEAFLAATKDLVDPSRCWRAWEAKETAGKLKALLLAHDVLANIGEVLHLTSGEVVLAGDVLKALVIWELTGGVVEGWIEDFAEKLSACATYLHNAHDSHGGCWTYYTEFIWEGDPIPEFETDAQAEWCEHMNSAATAVWSCNGILNEKEYEEYVRRQSREAAWHESAQSGRNVSRASRSSMLTPRRPRAAIMV